MTQENFRLAAVFVPTYPGEPSLAWLREKERTEDNIRNAYNILGLGKVHYLQM